MGGPTSPRIVILNTDLEIVRSYSYIHGQTGLLGYGEVACGIICCCLPLIPLFWRHIAHSPTSLEHPELQNGNGVHKEKLEDEIPRAEKRDEEALHEAISGISPKT